MVIMSDIRIFWVVPEGTHLKGVLLLNSLIDGRGKAPATLSVVFGEQIQARFGDAETCSSSRLTCVARACPGVGHTHEIVCRVTSDSSWSGEALRRASHTIRVDSRIVSLDAILRLMVIDLKWPERK